MTFLKRTVATVAALAVCAGLALADFVTTANPVHPNGTRATVDVPADLHIRNIGGSDGAGLCVGTSNELVGRWQSIAFLDGFQKWLAKRPGGSYPEMFARDLKLFAASKGQPLPRHIQHTGGDIEFLRLAIKTRRAVGLTYAGHDPFYGAQGIAHMVTAAHLDGKLGAIIDNNEPGRWRWMDDSQLVNRWLGKLDNGKPILVWTGRGWMEVGGGWAVVWLDSPPPPMDKTARDYLPERPIVPQDEEEKEENPAPPQVVAGPWQAEAGENPALLNGVNSEHLQAKMRYWINGQECDRCDAMKLLRGDDGLTDDSALPFVTVVSSGTAEEIAAVKLAGEKFRGKFHLNVVKPDSWLVTSGRVKSKVTAQFADGKTVFASDVLDAKTLEEAIKKALKIEDPPPVMPQPKPPVLPDAPKVDPAQPPLPPTPAPDAPKKQWLVWLALAAFIWWITKPR